MTANRSASVLARLLNLSKGRGDDYSLLLNRFALERLLCRLAASAHAERFLLKGALLFSLWYDQPHRPTRDADLLGFGPDDSDTLTSIYREIAAISLGDGIEFDPQSVRPDAIRQDNRYGGLRVRLTGRIDNARCAMQIDVGFGDAVTPAPQVVVFPVLLDDLSAPTLRVYPVYTVTAEKYHAMTILGQANSRMKDFFDIATIAQRTDLDGATLARAIAATFARRNTAQSPGASWSVPLPAHGHEKVTRSLRSTAHWATRSSRSRRPDSEHRHHRNCLVAHQPRWRAGELGGTGA